MNVKLVRFLFFFILCFQIQAQSTDVSIVAQAQSLGGTDVSQVEIFEDFQYIVTIINSGNAVNNATFQITMDEDLQNLALTSITSQNNIGGASDAGGFNLSASNVLTGSVNSLPSDSSVEIKIEVTAPSTVGGIAINAIISPPDGTTDTNTSNNQSLISIDVIDVDINFSVTHSQISPAAGTPIPSWNSPVTYRFTITNNSEIDFPVEFMKTKLNLLTSLNFGRPNVQLISVECIEATNGTECPNVDGISGSPVLVSATVDIFNFTTPHVYTAGGAVTYEIVYQYLDPSCAIELNPINVQSRVEIGINHINSGNSLSSPIVTNLLESELCQTTDICIDTIQIDPDPTIIVDWNQEVTFETTVCNNGPLDANIAFFLQNLAPSIEWEILSAECIGTTGTILCDDVNITINDIFWVSDAFVMPVDATVTIRTIARFLEPECSINTDNNQALIRSGTNVLEADILDSNLANSAQNDYVLLPPTSACEVVNLNVTKTQISPELPNGGSEDNPTQLGEITYEITVTNPSEVDTFIELQEYIPGPGLIPFTGTLVSVNCVSTTGSANCLEIQNTNIGIEFDGVPQSGEPDIFWEILPEDNWSLPAMSSVTFQLTVLWDTDCSVDAIPVFNAVSVGNANSNTDNNFNDNLAQVATFFAPCVDLVVQTFPEFTQVNVNQDFDWIIDITNSETSSNAINIDFENTVNDVFTINGTPTCEVTNGSATCITNLDIVSNVVTGTIDNMEAASTIRIRIPVTAPSFGGAYNNIAVATPNENDNREISPETNTSISNVQIVAPILSKSYDPTTITIGEQSTLTFTIQNLPNSPSQNNISFTDIFPSEISLVSPPEWVEQNGCSTTFLGNAGDNFVGVDNLVLPEGVSFCSFSVVVTSNTPGVYLNDTTNFDAQNNIDTSQTNATLTVLDDPSNVDIEVLKTVNPQEVSIGEQVTFQITISNLGTTQATSIEILDEFPNGMNFISATTTEGFFDDTNFIWSVETLDPNQSATLTIVAQIISGNELVNVALLNQVNEPDRDDTNNMDSAEVFVDVCLFIPDGLSPNGDGLNDTFFIECIDEYVDNLIKIYNRYGTQIYERRNYENDWDGRPNIGLPEISTILPVGNYFYILDLNNGQKPIFGWVYLNY
ncbi:T9SS C-terminal target domain-containing protein [Psychroserpens sp. Hel_I_66]|uniref:T9SS C-terminal target domain-containing protein n=1 Tax=Psychroserpens sp. Hel_I_66 TaxID=1250004 RepID=UPI0006479146|nr:T9SS C-terminal target domain-containing protein [Psychroserpens sp. Hel_I_66]